MKAKKQIEMGRRIVADLKCVALHTSPGYPFYEARFYGSSFFVS
ncbi:MAG: hypothetical protein AB1631_33060 [Acidobacteriota bacterium]